MKKLLNLILIASLGASIIACKPPSATDTVAAEPGDVTDPVAISGDPILQLKGSLTENTNSLGELEIVGQVTNTGGAGVWIKANCNFFDIDQKLIDVKSSFITGSTVTLPSGVTTDTALKTGETGTFKVFSGIAAEDVSSTDCNNFSFDLLEGNTETDPTDPAAANNLGSAGGVWRGAFTPDNQATYAIKFYKAMITPGSGSNVVMLSDNESSLEIQGSDMLKSTSFVQTSAEITINLKEFKKENVAASVDVEIIAQLTPAGKIEGTYTRGAETGAVLLEYDPIYERGDRVAFFYTENTYWRLSKATLIDDGTETETDVPGNYQAAFSIDDSFNMLSRDNGGVVYTYTTDKKGSADADDAVTLSEDALAAEAAVSGADPADPVAVAKATADAASALTIAANAVNAAIDAAIAAGDPNTVVEDVDIEQYRTEPTDDATKVNGLANGLASALTASGELFEYTEQRLALPDGATLISFHFPRAGEDFDGDGNVDISSNADSNGCIYAGNFDIVDPRFFMYNVTFNVTGAGCPLNGVYTGMAAIEEEFQPLDADGAEHLHTHYQFLTFGVSSTTTGKTINNRLTLNFFGT